MPDNFKETINIPIAIPAWGLLTMLVGGVFFAGVTNQKLDQVIEQSKKIDVIQERQIKALEVLNQHTQQLQNHENRITDLERKK